MAKIQIISTNIPEYNKMIYFKNPSEVDAELYSFQKTVEYFDTHCLNNNNVPKINARDKIHKTINVLHHGLRRKDQVTLRGGCFFMYT